VLVNTEASERERHPTKPAGTCECKHTNHFFTLGVEDLTVQIEHLWQTTFAHGAFPETRVKKDGGEGYKVRAALDSFAFPSSMLGGMRLLALALCIHQRSCTSVRSLAVRRGKGTV
jgi:hypothetical protein